jgi:ribosomal protein L34E
MSAIHCKECGAQFDGDRRAARLARWEPFSTQTQKALDRGPMVCPDCVKRVLDELLTAMSGVSW